MSGPAIGDIEFSFIDAHDPEVMERNKAVDERNLRKYGQTTAQLLNREPHPGERDYVDTRNAAETVSYDSEGRSHDALPLSPGEQFEIFKVEVKRLLQEFGLLDWYPMFRQEDTQIEGAFAETEVDCGVSRGVTFRYPQESPAAKITIADIKEIAMHEVLELLFADMRILLGEDITITQKMMQFDRYAHAAIHRLMQYMKVTHDCD